MIGRYGHTIPETPNFDSNMLLTNLIPGNCAIDDFDKMNMFSHVLLCY